jgi:site-specific recombinase XerD
VTPSNQQLALDNPAISPNPADVFGVLDVNEATRSEYQHRIRAFLAFLQGRTFTQHSFLEFKRHLAARSDLSAASKNKYLFTAKIFLRELYRRGALPADITAGIKGFNQGRRHKRDGLSDAEMAALTERLRELPHTPRTTRLKALCCLLALQGLRQVEVIRLNVADIELGRRVAFIQGKGSDDTEPISLHPATVKALADYLKTNRLADGPLFTSQSNNHRGQRLTTRAIRLMVRQMLDELGIDKSTHGFRHYFTTRLIKTYKGDLLEVRQYTRHSSLEMLQIYNDSIKQEADLPRFYSAFEGVAL